MNRKHNQPISEMDFPDHDRHPRRHMSPTRRRRLGTTVAVTAVGASLAVGAISGAFSSSARAGKGMALAAGEAAKESATGNGSPAVEAFANDVEQGYGTVEMGTNSKIPEGTLLYSFPSDESQVGGGDNNSVPVPTGEDLSVSGLVVGQGLGGPNSAPWQAVTVDFTGKPELMFTPYNDAYGVAQTNEDQSIDNTFNPHVSFNGPFIYVSGKGVDAPTNDSTTIATGTLIPTNQ